MSILTAASPEGSGGNAAARSAAEHRAEALARTAPWLALLSSACAGVMLWMLWRSVPAMPLIAWGALVLLLDVMGISIRRRFGRLEDPARMGSVPWAVGGAFVRAMLWISLPVLFFPHVSASEQVVMGGALATMMAGAFLLATVPLAALLWALLFAGALLWGLHGQGGAVLTIGKVLVGFYSVVIIVATVTVDRLLSRHVDVASAERARGEAIVQLLREYEEQGAGWLWQTDSHHRLTYVSPRLCDRLGRSSGQLLGQSLPILLGCDAALGQALATRDAFAGLEVRSAGLSGDCWMTMSASPILAADGAFAGFRGLGADVTEARRAQERIQRVALVDDLTGLPNRQRMRALMGDAVTRAAEADAPCMVIFADLDGFKQVNDRFGHAIGDIVLRAIAERLATTIGDSGSVGRLGGDEFAILLDRHLPREELDRLGGRLIAAVSQPVPFDRGQAHVGLSLGCVRAPADGRTLDDLLAKADIALYESKARGRGRLTLFDGLMQRDAEERALLEADLRQALARGELRLDYQPVVDIRSRAILGFEALLRWSHPVRGIVPPVIFVPVAEQAGLIGAIGDWVLRTACADAASWPGQAFVTVNLSRAQLALPGLTDTVDAVLKATALQPARLELEVTESVFNGDDGQPLDVLRRLRALGVGIALDDFGRGHASLGYMNRTIFHTLKLDGSFVRDAADRSETLAVIRAIVALATSFHMTVTAEGVESFEDFARMKELGCERVQGYLFGRPMPCADATALIDPAPAAAAA